MALLTACEQPAEENGSAAAPQETAPAPAPEQEPALAPDITAAELNELIMAGQAPLIIDVRTQDEFAAGHLPGAVNIAHTDLGAKAAGDSLPGSLDTEIVVHCQTGRRAAMAQATLVELGFTKVRHLDGDYAGWAEAGLPIEATE
jgi:rhodanese-related sulfurtransferase